jgi:hypothetical protein
VILYRISLPYVVVVGLLVLALAGGQRLYGQARRLSVPLANHAASQSPARYRIDTNAILTNRYLPRLLILARGTALHEFQSAQALPPCIRSFLTSSQKGQTVAIADVGGKYEATDALSGDQLPRRQLLYLGVSKDVVLLAYNLGGFASTECVLLFRLQDQHVCDFWTGHITGQHRQTTKESILRYLQAHKEEHWGLNTNIVYF